MKKIKISQTHLKEMVKKILAEESVEKKDCRKGMYWCNVDKICKPSSQKIDDLKSTEEVSEAVGFVKTYSGELENHLKSFIDVVCGHLKEQVATKQLYGEEAIVQRLYQLLVEEGELHTPVQELINIIDSLPDKENRPVGFRGSYMKDLDESNGVKRDLYSTLKLAKQGEFTEEDGQDSLLNKVMAKLKGIGEEQTKYNKEHGLPLDWRGSKEGYHEFITNKRFHSGSN
tara:strand:- start:44419 stop:45105 length:687 start_codon:yes stop_codon:yes gene_type:complete